MHQRLTDRKLQALKPAAPGKRYDVMDTDVRGFGVRVTDKGQRTFMLLTRYPGSTNPTRRAIGEYPTLTLEKARAESEGLATTHRGQHRSQDRGGAARSPSTSSRGRLL